MSGGCCGSPRRSVSDYLDRALRRNRAGLHRLHGAECRDGNDLSACFSAELAGKTIHAIGFKVSSCATLLAYSEMLAELAAGQDIAAARRVVASDLVAALPEVPPLKRDRALLAAAAFVSLLHHATNLITTGEEP